MSCCVLTPAWQQQLMSCHVPASLTAYSLSPLPLFLFSLLLTLSTACLPACLCVCVTCSKFVCITYLYKYFAFASLGCCSNLFARQPSPLPRPPFACNFSLPACLPVLCFVGDNNVCLYFLLHKNFTFNIFTSTSAQQIWFIIL